MGKLLIIMMMSAALISCSQNATKEVDQETVLIQSEEIDNKIEQQETEKTEESEVETDSGKLEDDTNAENPETTEEKTESDEVAIPAFKNLPEDALYEAMVLAQSGVNVHEQPDLNSNTIGSLIFGAHVYAILDANDMTYIYANGIEGWVSQSYVKQIPYDSSKKIEIENPDDLLVIVNKQYKLPMNYKPADLVIPNVPFPFDGKPEKKYMRDVAAKALEEMFLESQKAGLNLYATSGYRSFATQQRIFPGNVNRVGFQAANQYSAFPGESEHQTGLAMDVTNKEVNFTLVEKFGATKEGIWVQENAHKFGFIIRYPKGKEHITGYAYEPWHLRYVGKEIANTLFEMNLTLEEYLN